MLILIEISDTKNLRRFAGSCESMQKISCITQTCNKINNSMRFKTLVWCKKMMLLVMIWWKSIQAVHRFLNLWITKKKSERESCKILIKNRTHYCLIHKTNHSMRLKSYYSFSNNNENDERIWFIFRHCYMHNIGQGTEKFSAWPRNEWPRDLQSSKP